MAKLQVVAAAVDLPHLARVLVPRRTLVDLHQPVLELLVRTVEVDTMAEELQPPTLPVKRHQKDLLQQHFLV